jgi:hypothetical protein
MINVDQVFIRSIMLFEFDQRKQKWKLIKRSPQCIIKILYLILQFIGSMRNFAVMIET